MGDFYKTEEEKIEPEIEKIKVGEKEYTTEELQNLVGIADKTLEIEKTLNTKIDRVYPEFTKTSQKAKEYEEKNREYEAKIKDFEERASRPQNLDDNAIKEAREAAKKIGIVTKDDFATFMQEHFRPYYLQERQAERLIDECKDYEKKYNGEDGRPKFKTEEVLQWMQENGGKNPEKAYKLMYEDQIDSWKEKELSKAKKQGMVTEDGSSAGAKEPPKVPITRDNLQDLIRESLGQG